MSCFQRVVFVVATLLTILVLCSASAFGGYAYGHDQGYFSGEKSGMEAGYAQGFQEGKGKGYKDGYAEGQRSGYQLGYDAGFKEGIGSGYTSRNPTYQEMKEFLAQDKTDAKRYIRGQYVCSDFAAEVNNNAETKGIRCAVVELRYPGDFAHAIIAFETTDRGLIFIEPQFDAEVTVKVGLSYSQSNGYERPPYDDTITRILVMW